MPIKYSLKHPDPCNYACLGVLARGEVPSMRRYGHHNTGSFGLVLRRRLFSTLMTNIYVYVTLEKDVVALKVVVSVCLPAMMPPEFVLQASDRRSYPTCSSLG